MSYEQVGDVNSDEKGSGARYNAGKPELDLIPLHVWIGFARVRATPDWVIKVLSELHAWQVGAEVRAENALVYFTPDDFEEAARVFEYGKEKYAAWNWAKGMPWSVPLGCALRHMLPFIRNGLTPPVDSESGLSHKAHALCNLIMLAHFEKYYPEGDDRPPQECF